MEEYNKTKKSIIKKLFYKYKVIQVKQLAYKLLSREYSLFYKGLVWLNSFYYGFAVLIS